MERNIKRETFQTARRQPFIESEWEKTGIALPNNLQAGLQQGLISLSDDGKRITYCSTGKSYKFTDPEEPVRADYYIQLVIKYGYPSNRLDVEVAVPRRTPNDFADIVVYKDSDKKEPYIIVECKPDGISDSAFSQAIEQVFGNANSLRAAFAAAVAGNTRRFFDVANHPAAEREANVVADVPVKYGRVEESKFKKDDPAWDVLPVERSVLLRTLAKCHDSLWDGGRMDATEAFDELCKFIFVKMQDEMRARKKGEPYDFQIKTNETPTSVHERVTRLYNQAKEVDSEVFSDSFSTGAEKTFAIVNHLEGISLSKTDLDTKGVAFEMFMEDFFRGKQGQFFTPREIVKFVISICDIDRESLVLDPACGSGGFLLYAMDHVRSFASEYYGEGTVEHYKHWHDFAATRLYGIEVNDRISRVAKMNMVLHDDGHTNVVCHDALCELGELSELNSGLKAGRFDIILTNPPFGAKVKFDEKPYSNNYELGKKKSGTIRKEQKSEILFIERCWEFLKPGTGHLAIVLPDGILTNHTQNYVRDFLLDKFEIKAIVSLPQVTFLHYGAGAKSSVLVGRKRDINETKSDYRFFSAVSESVGYDATGRTSASDLASIIYEYRAFADGGKDTKRDFSYTKLVSEFNQNRIDPYYYSPEFDRIAREMASSKYELLRLDKVCVDGGIFSGATPKKDDYSDNPNDAKIVKVASLKHGRVNFDQTGYVKAGAEGGKRVMNGDILMLSSAHQADYLGRNPCIVEMPNDESVSFVAELMCLRADQDKIDPYYLIQVLATETYYHLINRERRGQTSHIYPRDICKIRIPVPDLAIQKQVASSYRTAYSQYRKFLDDAGRVMTETASKFENQFMPS